MMANGTDAKEKLLAKVRPGLKREFEFAFRAHSEICGGSPVMGRTRSTRSQGGSSSLNFTPKRSKVSRNDIDSELIRSKKKVAEVKGSGEEEEEDESGVVELGSGDEEEKRVVVESVAVSGLVSGGIVLALGRVEKKSDIGVKVVDEGNVGGEGSGGVEGVSVEVNGELVLGLGNVERKSEVDVEEGKKENVWEEGSGGLMVVDVGNVGGEGSGVLMVVDEGNVDGEGSGGVEDVSEVVNGGLVLGLGDVEMKSEVDVKEGKENVCGEGGSGLMAVSGLVSGGIVLGLGYLEKKNDFDVKGVDKGAEKSDSEVNEDDKGNVEKSDIDVKEDDQGNLDKRSDFDVKDVDNGGAGQEGVACEEGTSGSSSVSVLVDGGVVTGFSVYSCAKVEEMPFRRFTRSALKVKMEMEEECSAKGGAESVNGSMGEAKVDNLAGSPANAAATAATNDLSYIISKNGMCKSFPSKLKDFLDSGILEGVKVKYIRGSKAKALGEAGLQGVIKGSDILCFCGLCKGKEVVTPTVFELHAGSLNKRPPEYIYLENGNTLRDVMNACKNAAIQNLDEAVLRISSGCSSLRKAKFCFNCRGMMVASGKSVLVCDKCLELKQSQVSSPERTDVKIIRLPQESQFGNTNLKNIQPPQEMQFERTDIKRSFPEQPVVQEISGRMVKSSASRSKSQGKLTRKDLRLHKLVFEEDILPDGTEVAYYARGKKLLMGYKKGYGIVCSCCDSEVSPSQFEAHAGWASRRKPYLHIYTSNGVSLHELSISLCKSRKFSTQENDDLCQICQDGGDLICCDGCPRSFHKECLHLPVVPKGEFYCKFCLNAHQQEKCVERNANAIAAGRIAGIDPIDQISRRCIRMVKVPGADFGGCALCRDPDFAKGFGPRTVLLCDQCEREFHVGCLRDHKIADLKELPTGKWFCCPECNRIHSALQKLVFHGEERLPDTNVDVIKKKFEESSSESGACIDVRWRLLSGKLDPDDSLGLLSAAIAIFHEQFTPIAAENARKGDQDLIPRMVKGENIMEHDFGGMYCAVLLVNHVIVSAAIIRIFGQEVAELPLIATSSKCQGKGYFQALFNCIEKLLGFLDVKNLVLPAVEESESIWTNKFGFNQMTQDELLEFRRFYGLMIFQGSTWLQKSVPKCRIVGRSEGG